MSITGMGSVGAAQVQRLIDMRKQLDELQRQVGTQKVSDNYAGIGADRGLTVNLRRQLANYDAFDNSNTNIDTRLKLAQLSLTTFDKGVSTVKAASAASTYILDDTGQTKDQHTAYDQFDTMLSTLNTRLGDQYIFSGRSSDKPAVETSGHILNGDGVKAGLLQLIDERRQADLGLDGLGRLVLPANSLAGSASPLKPDQAAVATGNKVLGPGYASAGGTLTINTVTVTIPAGADAAGVRDTINATMTAAAAPGKPAVTASLDPSNHLVLTSKDADTDLTVAAGTPASLLTEIGQAAGTTTATNLLSQLGGALNGKTLSVTIGANPPVTVTFGTGVGEVSTIAEMNTALAAVTGGKASVDPATGNLTAYATNAGDGITIGGTAAPTSFGLAAIVAPPDTAASVAEDVANSAFGFKLSGLSSSIAGAAISTPGGAPPVMSIDLAAATPKQGDTVTFSLKLPDGTTEPITLTATTKAQPLTGTGGFTGVGGTVTAPGAITVQAPGLNGGVAVNVSIATGDTAATAADKINIALAAAGRGGVMASVSGGQLVLTSETKEVITMGGDPAALTSLGFAAGNRVSPPIDKNQFCIAATNTDTAASLRVALGTGVATLAQTSLRSASAIQASHEFFETDATHKPQRVNGPPFATATTLVDGTAANTVSWYTGESSDMPARATATSLIDQDISVSFGMRANETAFASALADVAAMAAMSFSTKDTNGSACYSALMQRVTVGLGSGNRGVQQTSDIEADIGGSQKALQLAKDRHTQTKAVLTDLLDSITTVPLEETSAKVLALQTNLSASLQTTALLSKLSLVNYM